MATFSQQFLANLGNAGGMLQGASDLGGAIGGVPGQIKEKQKQEADNTALSKLDSNSSEYYAEVARQLLRDGKRIEAMRFTELAKQMKNQEISISAGKKAITGGPTEMREAAGDFAGIGDVGQSLKLMEAAKSETQKRGVAALSKYAATKGLDLNSTKGREGFFIIANVYELPIDQSTKMYDSLRPSSFLTAPQKADLLGKGYNSDNIESYAQTGNTIDLGVPSEEVREGMTSFEKTMIAAGLKKGSEEWTDLSKKYANNLANGQIKTLSLSEQISMVLRDLSSNPMLITSEKNSVQSRKALATIAEVKKLKTEGRPVSEMERVIERTVSELYNADTRAASEIQRFLEDKGLPRTAADWIGGVFAGEITDDSLNALEGLATLVNEISQREIDGLVNGYLMAYDGIIDEKGITNVRNRYAQGYSATAQRQIDRARSAQNANKGT
jgi:hypothetical protein